MVLLYRFSRREIEPGIVSNVLVEAAGQAQSPPPRDAEPVAPPRRRSLKETSFDAEVGGTQLHWLPLMDYLHNRTRTPLLTQIWTPNLMATLYCIEIVPFAQIWTQYLIRIQITSCYCTYFWERYRYTDRHPSPCPAM